MAKTTTPEISSAKNFPKVLNSRDNPEIRKRIEESSEKILRRNFNLYKRLEDK